MKSKRSRGKKDNGEKRVDIMRNKENKISDRGQNDTYFIQGKDERKKEREREREGEGERRRRRKGRREEGV